MDVLVETKAALDCRDPKEKAAKAADIFDHWQVCANLPRSFPSPDQDPGRPEKPVLVPPSEVPRRGIGTVKGRAVLMHAVGHIEFNAINLALDLIVRFANDEVFTTSDKQVEFIGDWLSVAADEARHFLMISKYLESNDYEYGTFPAHSGLWDAAIDTSHDIAARLAVAPMVLEARGLDVTPQIIEKLRKNHDSEAVNVLEVILKEEVQHVYFGTKWFNFVAEKRAKDPVQYFQELVRSHFKGLLKPPFNKTARFEAELYEDFYLPLS